MLQQEFYNNQESHHYYDQDAITVTQHLTPEQYLYEFPTRDCLEALSYLDNDTQDSCFDLCSFVSSSAAFTSAYYNCYSIMDHEMEDELVDDGRLSPLQLPAQLVQSSRPVEPSSTLKPVGPSSFLADVQLCDHVTQTDVDSLDFDSSDSIISSTIRTLESRVVLIKLNRSQKQLTFIKTKQTDHDGSYSDEGYDDTTELDEELESNCIFYPIQENDDEQTKAAIRIQALWRGYCSRKQHKSNLKPDQQLLVQLMKFSNRVHHRQMQFMQDRLAHLEHQVRQESAMRTAFEKAMEDTVVLMDQQQKVIYDRLEQEVHLRQTYEAKVKTTLDQLQPLESRLRKETNARLRLEEMMTRVLDQMHASEESRKKQIQQDEASRCQLQAKLDQALSELDQLKRKDTSRPSNIPNTSSRRQPRSTITPTKTSPIERPSIVPSIRRSAVQQKSSTTNRRK
ncbi:hypothetical protein A0J61_10025 [Choanephora cucurbitarum]|uniref:Uncharacterized protein n=1 Tax=Choanephora cucurbitarum TaxID=101091 RepID=A0A1C7MYE2_9FUNG|nr:hypothetical protein A0J61_10025 [Choanephora cucurbitarum]